MNISIDYSNINSLFVLKNNASRLCFRAIVVADLSKETQQTTNTMLARHWASVFVLIRFIN
jgi:hypothetical protein